jgi:hypothetical protein
MDFVRYRIPFNGDFGLHDAPWQTISFGSPGYRGNASHGCGHLPMPAIALLSSPGRGGTTVNVQSWRPVLATGAGCRCVASPARARFEWIAVTRWANFPTAARAR